MGQDGWSDVPRGGPDAGTSTSDRRIDASITLDDLPVPTALLRPDWTYAWVSIAYAELLGARPDQLLHRYADELVVPGGERDRAALLRLLPGDARAVPRLLRMRDPGQLGRSLFQLLSAIRNATGDVCFLLVQALLVRDGDAAPLHEVPPIRRQPEEEPA